MVVIAWGTPLTNHVSPGGVILVQYFCYDQVRPGFFFISKSLCPSTILSTGFSGTPNNGTPLWEASHTIPIRIPKDMRMVWEASHKGVPLLGVPEKFPYPK